jgi:hypothetical protein
VSTSCQRRPSASDCRSPRGYGESDEHAVSLRRRAHELAEVVGIELGELPPLGLRPLPRFQERHRVLGHEPPPAGRLEDAPEQRQQRPDRVRGEPDALPLTGRCLALAAFSFKLGHPRGHVVHGDVSETPAAEVRHEARVDVNTVERERRGTELAVALPDCHPLAGEVPEAGARG